MSAPRPTAKPGSLHARRFPNETAAYRRARNALLRAEIDLRRRIEAVAAKRRALPAGGEVPEDYVFEAGAPARAVRLSELFGDGDTLVVYSFMYAPQAEKPCPMCTSVLDGLNGNAQHVAQTTRLVVIGKSPLARLQAHADARGWSNLRMLSSAGNAYNRDYFGENADGSQLPMMNVFVRREGRVRHFWASEMLFAPADAAQNNRHVDALWPLWNVLDLTPAGRPATWYPQLAYAG